MSEKVIEVEADSVEEAIDKGLKRLGQDQSDTEIEIIQDPNDEIFETGSEPAKVRMTAKGIDLLDSLHEIVTSLLDKMGLENFSVEVSIQDEFYRADIESDQALRFVIGRYGETLNALQHLAERMLNRVADRTVEVIVDADNYRERRRKDLVKLASEVSSKALKEDREIELEPMIGVERKIVHEAVRDIEGVKTHSIGEDTNRRVVILPKGQS
jgi:spoIIIJ-associated protein